LNRAPTLHRLGIQAFEPKLIEGKAIQLHPLVCTAFNADFDGDQMAVHVPLSIEAQMEARVLMMSTNNILSPAHGKPIINPTQDIVLGCYYLTSKRPFSRGQYTEDAEGLERFSGIYSSAAEVRMAYDLGAIDLHAEIMVRLNGELQKTSVGRVLLWDIIPEGLPFSIVNKVLDKKALSQIIDASYRTCGNKATVILADRLRTLGFEYASRAGISICMDNMVIPETKVELLGTAQAEVERVVGQYQEGLITDGERYNKVVDIWAAVSDKVAEEMLSQIRTMDVADPETGKSKSVASFNPIYIMADSGARGSNAQLRQLAGMRGLMAKPSGEIIETPITANFREGLTVLQYFISTHGARKGLADTALKTANSGYLTRRLVDVAQDATISEFDCGTLDGIEVTPLEEGGEVIETLGERVLGRTALDDIYDPFTGELLVDANELIDEDKVNLIKQSGVGRVTIRSVLTCQTQRGICAKCYGRDLARGYLVNIGEAVGIIAAQSIGEPGTQLTMRTFHIGGAAKRGKIEQSKLEATRDGVIRLTDLKFASKSDGTNIVMDRHKDIILMDDTGREHVLRVVYGASLLVTDGQTVKSGDLIAEWDPYSIPYMSEVAGIVKFGDVIEGVSMMERLDEVTGLSRKVIIDSRDPELRPRVSVKDEHGNTKEKEGVSARYLLPVDANITVAEGDFIDAGEVLAKIPRETTKTKDITGGLPRVAELFEARKPKEHAIISEIDGSVGFGKDTKGKRKLVITPEVGDPKEYLVAKGKHISVKEGDRVQAGEPLMDGAANPHDILRVNGEKALAKYLVDEIQEVYRLQGVSINDKHIETIVRQMLRRVTIKDVGDTTFLVEDKVDKTIFKRENERVIGSGGRPATAEALLLGITKASLSTESFISASSFQETTKVLTEAAISGKVDELTGPKENVIMGRLIPAGTGVSVYHDLTLRTTKVPDVENADGIADELEFEEPGVTSA
jgi:DNA-directed RNA polymerase subunit beta'